MLKRALLTCALLLIASAGLAANPSADQAAGVWQTATGGYVQLYQDNGKWVGTIVGSRDGKARYDKKNPDKSKRGRRLLGVTVLKGLNYEGEGEFGGGEIYDPNSGKTYKAAAQIKGPDTLEVRGYVGISLFGKSQTWSRVAAGAKHVHQDLLHQSAPGSSSGS